MSDATAAGLGAALVATTYVVGVVVGFVFLSATVGTFFPGRRGHVEAFWTAVFGYWDGVDMLAQVGVVTPLLSLVGGAVSFGLLQTLPHAGGWPGGGRLAFCFAVTFALVRAVYVVRRRA